MVAIIAVGGCTQESAPDEREPDSAELTQTEPTPPMQEFMASLEVRGERPPRLTAPVYEVTHHVGEYRPLRSLPVLISRTPASDPSGGRPYFAQGHGVETTVRPKLKTTTLEDGFPFLISWNPAFEGKRIPVDLVATLADTRFRFDDGTGEVLQLRPMQRDAKFGVMQLLFVLSSEGLEIEEGLVEPYGPSSRGSLKLPWEGGRRRALDRPGRWRVQVTGNLHFFTREPLPFESSWVEFHLESPSSSVVPLAEIPDLSRQLLAAQIDPEDSPASFQELLGENDAGNRVAVFGRGGVDHRWVQRTSLVELSPSGELVGIWRDERHRCVAEGTMLETSRGTLPIEAVSIGDRVLSYDTEVGTHVWSKVQRVIVGQAQQVLVVDGELELTGSHPVWVDGAWRQAWDLRENSEIIGLDGNVEQVRSVVAKSAATVVYDLTVDYPHNYFADGFLVHNKSIRVPQESTWNYDPTIHRPEDLQGVVETAHEPMVECLRDKDLGYRPHRIESFVIEFQDGAARLIVLTPTAIAQQQTGARTQSFAPRGVEDCVEQVFAKLAETHAYPPGVPLRFYRFRLAGEGPRVDRVHELDVDTMVKGFVGQGSSLAQCLDQLAKRRDSFKGVLRDGSAVTLDVNFRDPSDPVSVVGLYEPAGAPYDGLKRHDQLALDACVESAVHPSWFDGIPPQCETTIRSTYRFERKGDSWDTSWKLLDVGPTALEKRGTCRPGTIKLRRALDGTTHRNKRTPIPRRSRGKALEMELQPLSR